MQIGASSSYRRKRVLYLHLPELCFDRNSQDIATVFDPVEIVSSLIPFALAVLPGPFHSTGDCVPSQGPTSSFYRLYSLLSWEVPAQFHRTVIPSPR